MHDEICIEARRKLEVDGPVCIVLGFRLPCDEAEAGWATLHCDHLPSCKPLAGGGLLQVNTRFVTFFVAEQPTQPEGRLQHGVDSRRPGILLAFASRAAGKKGVLGRVEIPGVCREADESVEREKKGGMPGTFCTS
jgi:hypothetical protein